jgi:hypothetical protein
VSSTELAAVFIDGRRIVENPGFIPITCERVDLSAGEHDVKLRYVLCNVCVKLRHVLCDVKLGYTLSCLCVCVCVCMHMYIHTYKTHTRGILCSTMHACTNTQSVFESKKSYLM